MPVAINVLTKVERGSFKVNCTVVSSSASTSSITFRSTTDPFSAAVSNVNTTSLVVNDSPSENVTSSRSFTSKFYYRLHQFRSFRQDHSPHPNHHCVSAMCFETTGNHSVPSLLSDQIHLPVPIRKPSRVHLFSYRLPHRLHSLVYPVLTRCIL